MKVKEAGELGQRIAERVRDGRTVEAYALLSPVLAQRTPFELLRCIGEPIGAGPLEPVNAFLERTAAGGTEGGWVVIAKVLEGQLSRDLAGALDRCRRFIIAADVWYAADVLGEGVVGQALVQHSEPALNLLPPWRQDASPWVRRAVGTGAHFWAKRSRGAVELAGQAKALLAFLEPMFEEWDMIAVKGVGWGLKTLGRHYPDLMADWLSRQAGRKHRALMLRKARTHVSEAQRPATKEEGSEHDDKPKR
jgi:3-methyladenine DNA glycosylase AlkD